jgi:hypothetical protein
MRQGFRSFVTLGTLALAALASARPARAAEDVEALLRRQTQELFDAVSAGTPAVWERYLDPRAVYTSEDGTVSTKAQMVADVKPLPPGVSGSIQVTGFRAVVHGTVAVATHVEDEHEDYHGHKLHCQYRTTDTWVKAPAGWRLVAGQVLALRTDPPAIQFDRARLAEYCGRYALTPEITYEIRCRDGGLEGQQTGRPAEALRVEAPDVLFVPGKPRYRKVFQRGPDGRIRGFAERREAWDLDWKRLP